MDQKMLDRISELAKKKKTVGLSEEELREQKELYKIYLGNIRRNVKSTLDNAVVDDGQGNHFSIKEFNKRNKKRKN